MSHDGDDTDELELEALLQRVTKIRGFYQAARRALQFARGYRVEDVVRRENWREDARIVGCLKQIANYRGEIRTLREAA